MADRSAASAFGVVFEILASQVDLKAVRGAAEEIFDETVGYDFSPDQMDCDDALEELGLYNSNTQAYGPQPTKKKR